MARMEGALTCGITVSVCVYRQAGEWHQGITVGADVMDTPMDVWVDPDNAANRLTLFFVRPMVVPDALHDELAAIPQADPTWSPASLILL